MATPTSTTQMKVIASAEVHRSTHKKKNKYKNNNQCSKSVRCRQEMWHLSVNIRQIYLVFRVYAATLHKEYEHLFSEDYSDIDVAESDAEDVKPDCPSFHQTALFELKHKVPSCIHNLLYNSYTSINAFTAFLCSKKNNLTVTYFHTQSIHIYIQVHDTCCTEPLPSLPKLLSLLRSVPHSCASHSTTCINGVAANLFEESWVYF